MARTDAYQATVDHEFSRRTPRTTTSRSATTPSCRSSSAKRPRIEQLWTWREDDFLIVDDLFGANSQVLPRLGGAIRESLCPITIPRVRGGAAQCASPTSVAAPAAAPAAARKIRSRCN